MLFNKRIVVLIVTLACVSVGWMTQSDQRPNFVFLLADDLGYGDLGCFGREDLATPVLDRLADQGVRLTAHYANGPECTPTRAAFLTGRYQQRVGGLECAIGIGNIGRYDDAIRLRKTRDLGLPATEQSIALLLQKSGYATCLSGKWHLGYEQKFAPNFQGFDNAFYCIGGGMDYFDYSDLEGFYNLYENGYAVSRRGYFTDLLTDYAIDFLEDQTEEKPFFLYVPFTAPHSPFQGPADGNNAPTNQELWRQGKAPPDVYIAMIEHIDYSVGRILDVLDEKGLSQNTVVFFSSDNGGTGSARNAPFSGIKGMTFEGGIRVPGIIRWPRRLPAGLTSDEPCLTFDFTASMAALAGVAPSKDKPLEGVDIVSHLAAGGARIHRDLFWRKERNGGVWKAVQRGSLKYIGRTTPDGNTSEYLFNLSNDPKEKNNLRESRIEDFKELKSVYDAWEYETRKNRRGAPGWVEANQ